ncbi:MAG: DUF3341 domain-containing protein [candidate division Zixibacteria bacterium]|nr:DUF3341 domain-containing protein [candidate division Zixibacteria bacterium]
MERVTKTAPHRVYGILAEFSSPGDLLHAAEKMRDAGFSRFDCHSPFPIHGMDHAMGLKRSIVGYVAGVSAFIGGGLILLLQWWASSIDYPIIIGGKPFFSYPAYVPVTFGVTILFAALGAVIAMLVANRLPQPFHGLFYSDRFAKFSNDGFFVSVESEDPKFDEHKTKSFLESIGGRHAEIVSGE